MTCPSCTSTNIYRSHARGFLERTARTVLPIHFYRCHDCNHRWARTSIRWGVLEKYTFSILYVFFIALLVLALIAAMLFLLVFRPA